MARSFNKSSSDVINTPTSASLNPASVSVSLWFRVDLQNGFDAIFDISGSGSSRITFFQESATTVGWQNFCFAGQANGSTFSETLGVWYHAGMTLKSGTNNYFD